MNQHHEISQATWRRVLLRAAAIAMAAAAGCTDRDEDTTPTSIGVDAPVAHLTSMYDILKMPTPVTLDGNLAEWAGVPAVSFQDDPGNGRGALNNSATVKLAWDGTYLYAAYNITDSELQAVQTTRDATDLHKDDEVELYLDPQGDGGTVMATTDYQFLANILEAVKDARGDGAGGKVTGFNAPSLQAKVVVNGSANNSSDTDVGYTVELRVAWSDLSITPAAGQQMRLDLVVGDRDVANQSVVESFDWTGQPGPYGTPNTWNGVQLVDRGPIAPEYDLVKVATSTITMDGDLSDWGGISAIPKFSDDPARGAAADTATVKLAWDATYLYAAYDITDTELQAVQTTRDATDLHKDDEVELYLDPQGDGGTVMGTTDYQLLGNILEAVKDARGDGAGGKVTGFNAPSLQAKVKLNGTANGQGADVGYTLEMRVAWADLGVTPASGQLMRLDLVVGDRDAANQSVVESFDWVGQPGPYGTPDTWKGVRLTVDNTAPSPPTAPAASAVSASQIQFSWTASPSGDAARYKIYRGTTGTPALLTSVTASPYNDTGLTAGTTYSYQVSAVDPAGNESAKTAVVSATTPGSTGLPFGPFGYWNSTADMSTYNLSHDQYGPSNLASRVATAKQRGLKLVLVLSGGSHNADEDGTGPLLSIMRGGKCPTTPCLQFDPAKWGGLLDRFTTPTLKQVIADGVSDGVIIGADVMDEPYVANDGQGHTWGPDSTMTKARVDSLCNVVKTKLPGLPAGVDAQHQLFDGNNHYHVCDFIIDVYNNRFGALQPWADAGKAMAATDHYAILFGLNVLDGGVQDKDGTYSCDGPGQAGKGTFGLNCRMTASDLKTWGQTLGPQGCGLIMWRYDQPYFDVPANKTSLTAIRNTMNSAPHRECKRTP